MLRATNSPILRSTFKLYIHPVGSSIGALYQKLYIELKSASEDGRDCRPKHVELK